MLGWETRMHCEGIGWVGVTEFTSELKFKSVAAVVLMNSIYLLNYIDINLVGFPTLLYYIGYEYTS